MVCQRGPELGPGGTGSGGDGSWSRGSDVFFPGLRETQESISSKTWRAGFVFRALPHAYRARGRIRSQVRADSERLSST